MSAKPSTLKTDTAENFVGSIFKFSIATFVNMGIYALVFLLTNFLLTESQLGQIDLFINYTNTIMTIVILGLDQVLMRFYKEPPAGVSSNSLFRHCLYFSGFIALLALLVCSTLLSSPLYKAIGFNDVGHWVIPLLFLNAIFFMIIRYFNVLYRLEMNVKTYTIQSILMQFFYKLFYLVGAFTGNPSVAMILCSVLGLGGLAIVLVIIRRKTLLPQAGPNKSVYKTILPFGFAVAPTAIFVTLTGAIPKSIITNLIGEAASGRYAFAYQMSSIVVMVQGGFAAFWAPYMYANYKTQKERILKVHDFLNFVILVFFALLVAFEDILFWVFSNFKASMLIFPLLMLSAVFNILVETTVHGNAIARRPIFDTIGIILGACINMLLCFILVPRLDLIGAGIAICIGNFTTYLFRTITAQRLYKSIRNPKKTALALLIAILLAACGTAFAGHFVIKGLCCLVAIGVYCLMYKAELIRCWNIAMSLLKSIFTRKKAS